MPSLLFAEPQHIADLSDCWFYHSMDLPGIGEVRGQWDLRPTIDAYLGRLDYAGKRVLDVGTASGYLSFAMEGRGAEVVSFDIDSFERRHVVPYAQPRPDGISADEAAVLMGQELVRLRRGYWLAHRVLGSRARVCYGDISELDADALGAFDVVILGMVLPHLRDPFAALASVARLRARAIVIAQQMPQTEEAIGYFLPEAGRHDLYDAWWSLSAAGLTRMLGVLGYEVTRAETCQHACPARGDSETEACTTLVAQLS
jgi:SAM-dependent methyltransferase